MRREFLGEGRREAKCFRKIQYAYEVKMKYLHILALRLSQ